jgi:hypothetical protein
LRISFSVTLFTLNLPSSGSPTAIHATFAATRISAWSRPRPCLVGLRPSVPEARPDAFGVRGAYNPGSAAVRLSNCTPQGSRFVPASSGSPTAIHATFAATRISAWSRPRPCLVGLRPSVPEARPDAFGVRGAYNPGSAAVRLSNCTPQGSRFVPGNWPGSRRNRGPLKQRRRRKGLPLHLGVTRY